MLNRAKCCNICAHDKHCLWVPFFYLLYMEDAFHDVFVFSFTSQFSFRSQRVKKCVCVCGGLSLHSKNEFILSPSPQTSPNKSAPDLLPVLTAVSRPIYQNA